jgi:hypothetical protein
MVTIKEMREATVMTENTELLIIGGITCLIMLYLGWKILVGLIQAANWDKPSASWNRHLRKKGPWGAR